MILRKREVRPRIFLVEFRSQYEAASTFLRCQEFYESAKFRGRVFSLEEYMDWYAGKFKNFTYYEDWEGFNIPSGVLEPFYQGEFDPLSRKEKKLLDLFARERGDFYIIGAVTSPDGGVHERTLKHELAHGLFHIESAYRKEVLAQLAKYDTTELEKELLRSGYCRAVLKDEVHAYLLCGGIEAGKRKRLQPLKRTLRRLFRKYSTESDGGGHLGRRRRGRGT